jgi:hypothetical protein
MEPPEVKPVLIDDHFSVDDTLLQAWASHASLKRIDGWRPQQWCKSPGQASGECWS